MFPVYPIYGFLLSPAGNKRYTLAPSDVLKGILLFSSLFKLYKEQSFNVD